MSSSRRSLRRDYLTRRSQGDTMRSRTGILLIVVIVVVVAAAIYFTQQAAANNGEFILSGTIEVTETNLPTVSGGQVKHVYVSEGDAISKGQALVDVYS